jgi:hypothetical protein
MVAFQEAKGRPKGVVGFITCKREAFDLSGFGTGRRTDVLRAALAVPAFHGQAGI